MKKASVRGLSVPDKTSNQSSVINTQRGLDQLAVIAAILALIAAVIGLYIAWKTISLPGDTVVTV
jgi:ABC-type Mn2+/Zn2+ transport system permease subunit